MGGKREGGRKERDENRDRAHPPPLPLLLISNRHQQLFQHVLLFCSSFILIRTSPRLLLLQNNDLRPPSHRRPNDASFLQPHPLSLLPLYRLSTHERSSFHPYNPLERRCCGLGRTETGEVPPEGREVEARLREVPKSVRDLERE